MESINNKILTNADMIRSNAYAPYSKFAVGAILVAENGEQFGGCNIENRSFGLTMCAERVALGAAISKGNTRFQLLALVSDSAEPVVPCGACRQVLAEFAPDLKIVSRTQKGKMQEFNLASLFPLPSQGILD